MKGRLEAAAILIQRSAWANLVQHFRNSQQEIKSISFEVRQSYRPFIVPCCAEYSFGISFSHVTFVKNWYSTCAFFFLEYLRKSYIPIVTLSELRWAMFAGHVNYIFAPKKWICWINKVFVESTKILLFQYGLRMSFTTTILMII